MPQNETFNAILIVNSNSILVVASPRNDYPRSDITMPSSKGQNQEANIHTITAYQKGRET
jgi:hypothetical protein